MPLAGSAARRYAEAVVELATNDNEMSGFRASLERLREALGPEVLRALRNPRVSLDRRRDALAVATEHEPAVVRSLLMLLLERSRIDLLPLIAQALGDIVDRRAGIVKAKITTPVELASAQRDELVRRLEQASGTKIRASFSVDPSLLGGAKVQVGDHLIDTSFAAQLRSLARQLAS